MEPQLQKIIVLNFGGQHSALIARRVREAQVYCEVLPYDTPWEEIRKHGPAGVILAGGPASIFLERAPRCDSALFQGNVPVLGIGYGMHLMARQLGGKVEQGRCSECGRAAFTVLEREPLFQDECFDQKEGGYGWINQRDAVLEPPPGFKVLARTENGVIAAIGDDSRRLYGLQLHPAVQQTPGGMGILKSFLYHVCGCSPSWTPRSFVQYAVDKIKSSVGPEGRVVCALSGGVDSSVVAFLLDRAVGQRCVSIFVDHGLLRKGEAEQVVDLFGSRLKGQFIHVDARERFLKALAGITDPEQKRKIIGAEFINVFKEKALSLGDIAYLAQGTIYSDVIESGTVAGAAVIKSHHNVGGLPEELGFKLVEPLRELFKDEVRLVGRELGLPDAILKRQPFPGPGLAVRVIGEVTAEKLELLREADAIFCEEIEKAGLEQELWQYFAVHTGINVVGVKGGGRHYGPVVALRAVRSEDAMTADWAKLPFDLLERVSARITGEIPGLARVVLDITPKPPGTIEWE